MVLQGVGWERGMNLSFWEQGQMLCDCECDKDIQVLYNAGNFLTIWQPFSFSRRNKFNVCSFKGKPYSSRHTCRPIGDTVRIAGGSSVFEGKSFWKIV